MRLKPEILAPAGSVQALKAAIAAGCDAVYIGGSHFGARAYAENPDEEEMLEAIAYCHLFGVKIYMTVNTLLKDREIEEELFSFLRPYYEAGLDAVIVQDVGVLRFVSRHFPELAVHASTQMTLTMGKGALDLKKYHVTRIVPARELTIEELASMRRDTDLELEVFVHGALCYCYSGQCLFSSMLGGRSGNRGRCAQPCRMAYRLQGQGRGEEYLLSPKELCNLPFLPKLIEAGVDSFKIEGRMKKPEYTAFVVSIYRKYTDLCFTLGSKGYQDYLLAHDKEWQEDLRRLAELYNRNGFTSGYLEGRAGNPGRYGLQEKGQMLSNLRPKHGGVLVGKVLSVGKRNVIYQTIKKLSAQDVIEFRDRRQQPSYEYTIGKDIAAGQRVTANYQKDCRIQAGDEVYRTKDAKLLEEIRQCYLEKKKTLPVQARFTTAPDKPMCLQVTAVTGTQHEIFEAECFGEVCQRAEKHPATEEAVRKTLSQTGESPFYFEVLDIALDGELFLPVGTLKKLRRQALDELEHKIVSAGHRKHALDIICDKAGMQDVPETLTGQPVFSASVMLVPQLEEVLKRPEILTVYLHTEIMDEDELRKAFYDVVNAGKSPWLVMPAIFRYAVWMRFAKGFDKDAGLFSLGWKGYLVKNMESLHFLTEVAGIPRTKLRLDYNMYVMNREAFAFWQEQGIDKFTLPLEATEAELTGFSLLPQSELLIYGKVPLMVSAQCIQANTLGCAAGKKSFSHKATCFEDKKNREFEAVNYCKYCYNVIYQKEPLYIKKETFGNPKLCACSMRYSFTTESKTEVAGILNGQASGKTHCGHFRLGIQ